MTKSRDRSKRLIDAWDWRVALLSCTLMTITAQAEYRVSKILHEEPFECGRLEAEEMETFFNLDPEEARKLSPEQIQEGTGMQRMKVCVDQSHWLGKSCAATVIWDKALHPGWIDCAPKGSPASAYRSGIGDRLTHYCGNTALPPTLQAIQRVPSGCGYTYEKPGFDSDKFKKNYKTHWLSGRDMPCMGQMCTSATFLAFAAYLENLTRQEGFRERPAEQQKLIRKAMKYPSFAWEMINRVPSPADLVEKLGVGEGRIQYLGGIGKDGIPKAGDLIQIWRVNNSGHSAIFRGFLRNSAGAIESICYWSAQEATGGPGNRCEKMKTVKFLNIGSLK